MSNSLANVKRWRRHATHSEPDRVSNNGPETEPLISIDGLTVVFRSRSKPIHALNGVSLEINAGETFGMVGETGAGKSLTAWAAMGLLPWGADWTQGTVRFQGSDLRSLSAARFGSLRGREISIIVQNPHSALSPTSRVGDQIANAYQAHVRCSRQEARDRAIEGLKQVGIADAIRRSRSYPHELSIGMAQRVLIAMALLHRPKLLIADEPTSGLDVTIQAEVLDLIMSLVHQHETTLWLITHDLGVVANYCERAAVMFAGEIVEQGPVKSMFDRPEHPYTIGLIDSRLSNTQQKTRLDIAGPPPDLATLASGCRFAYRCPLVEPQCHLDSPPLKAIRQSHEVRCWVAQRASIRARDRRDSVER